MNATKKSAPRWPWRRNAIGHRRVTTRHKPDPSAAFQRAAARAYERALAKLFERRPAED